MRIVVAGPRDFHDDAVVTDAIASSGFTITELVCGEANGVDAAGKRWAQRHGIPVRSFYADWATYGRSAGPRRNGEMADYCAEMPDQGGLVAVWDGQSRGTGNMIRQALDRGLPVYVKRIDNPALSGHLPALSSTPR
jgi:hypothetical protein